MAMLELIKRYQSRRLRAITRGYRLLKQSNNLGLVRRIRGDLVDTRLDDAVRSESRFMLGVASDHTELAVRQYILAWLGEWRLDRALMLSLGSGNSPIIYPLPRAWRKVLREHGLVVAQKRCSFLWAGCVVAFWAHGVLQVGRHLVAGLWRMMRRESRMVTPYAYPLWLDMGHMPQPCEDGRSYDFITWYARWDGRAEEIGLIGHGVIDAEDTVVEGLQVRFVGKPIPALGSLTNAVRYSMWAFLAIFRSAFDALLGSWSHAVLLAEAARAAKVRFAEPRDLARDYLFHISQPCYRPLWTYEAEKRGSRILFYFYSASQEYKLPSGYEPERYAWGPMNWPHYLVWDKYQEEYVCGLLDYHPKIDIVGPIWSRDINVELPEIPRRRPVSPKARSGPPMPRRSPGSSRVPGPPPRSGAGRIPPASSRSFRSRVRSGSGRTASPGGRFLPRCRRSAGHRGWCCPSPKGRRPGCGSRRFRPHADNP